MGQFETGVIEHFEVCYSSGKAVNYKSKEVVIHGATDSVNIPLVCLTN
jgi:hypothetical protein